MNIDVYTYFLKNRTKGLGRFSAINDIEFRIFFKKISKKLEIQNIVEIGTYKGVSAAYMAKFVNRVYTFDIKDYSIKCKVWEDVRVRDKICSYVVRDRKGIKEILDMIEFDFAFIDGCHRYGDVKKDFELVKRCGQVLFHDVIAIKGVKKFVNELGNVKTIGNIGYWQSINKIKERREDGSKTERNFK